MLLKFVVPTLAAIGALSLLAAPVHAEPKQKRATYDARGNTVFTSRDENGRQRTRIIIQKRSYLDPGTDVLPGSRHDNDYAAAPNQRASSVLDNTSFGTNQSALPGPFDLPSRNAPFLRF